MTIGRMIAWGGQPLGAGIGGVVAQARGIRPAYLLAAALFAIAALVAARAVEDDPVRRSW
jgi:hypothetical protein